MNKGLLLLFVLLMVVHSASSIGAYPDAIEVKQPDGTVLKVKQHGDEWFNWTATTDGYRIVRNSLGVFEYAAINRVGKVVASGKKAYDKSNRPLEHKAFLNPLPLHVGVNESEIVRAKVAKAPASLLKSVSQAPAFPVSGSRKLLVILANFSDTQPSFTQSAFNNLMNQTNYNGTGSFRDYHLENSNGKLDITSTVTAWVTLPQTREYYAPEAKWGEFAFDAIKAADAAGVDFSQFDNDGDGTVDAIAIFHVGKGKEASSDPLDIWSHSSSLSYYGYATGQRTLDGKLVNSYTVQPEFNNNTISLCNIGVLCHEFGHSLGLPDYYDTDYEANGSQDGTGRWDLMGMGAYNNSNATPAHHNPLSKAELGWLTITTISSPAQMTLAPINSSQTVYRIDTQTANEYFLLENRTKTGFNASIPGEGMLIYHVDGSYIAANRTANTINTKSHQGFYIKKAAGTINTTACPYPGSLNNTGFSDLTSPSSLAWDGSLTNKSVTNITVDGSKNVVFDFMALQNGAPQTFSSTTIDFQSIRLAWTASTDNYPVIIAVSENGIFGTPVDGNSYEVGAAIKGGGTVIFTGSSSPFVHSLLNPKTSYYYKIWSNKGSSFSPALSASATTFASDVTVYPWLDDFESGLSNWSQQILVGIDSWLAQKGGYKDPNNNQYPSSAFSGEKNAFFFSRVVGSKSRLVSPKFVAQNGDKFRIMLQQAQRIWGADQDELRVYGKYESSDTWTLLRDYTSSIPDWKHSYIEITATESFQIALESTGNYGYGVVVDDFRVLKLDQALPSAASALTMVANSPNSITIGWTRGGGDKVMVVCREAGAVLGLPLNGASYTANAAFGSGSVLNPADYVVYAGDGTQVEITNLKIGTLYHFRAFEYNENGLVYQLSSPAASFYTVFSDVTFTVNVKDENGSPVPSASVLCGSQTMIANELGIATFVVPHTFKNVAYSASLAGMKTSWGKATGTQNRSVTVTLVPDEVTAPQIIESNVLAGNANLKWNPVVDEDFTGYEPFALSIPNWLFVDVDGAETFGLFGEEVAFTNEGYTGSFIVMNPYDAGGIDVPRLPYSGNQYIGCASAKDKANNDWIISPEFLVSGTQWLSFMAATGLDDWGMDRMRVLVSESGTELSSFVEISTSPYISVPEEWTLYSFDLSAYNGKKIRFAINCVSDDAFMLMLDNIKVTPTQPAALPMLAPALSNYDEFNGKESSPVNTTKVLKNSTLLSSTGTGNIDYKVYKNGVLVGQTNGMSANTFTMEDNTCDQRQFEVKAIKVLSGVENSSSSVAVSSCATVHVEVKSNGVAIHNASVNLGTFSGVTDQDGNIQLSDVPFNDYVLSVTAQGYDTYTANVTITEASQLAVELKKTVQTVVVEVDNISKVHPNPSSGIFRVEISSAQTGFSYAVYNMVGRKLMEKSQSAGSFSVDLGQFPNGIYLMEVNGGDKKYTFKLIKK